MKRAFLITFFMLTLLVMSACSSNKANEDQSTQPDETSDAPQAPDLAAISAKTHPFSCEDVLSVADYKKIINYEGNVEVTPDEMVGIYYKCNYQQIDENADWRTFSHSMGLNFEFPKVSAAKYYDVSRDTALGSYAKQISPDSPLTNEDVVGVGAKAYIPSLFKGSMMGVLSTNQKYYFSIQVFPDADNVFIKDIGKAIDKNLDKY